MKNYLLLLVACGILFAGCETAQQASYAPGYDHTGGQSADEQDHDRMIVYNAYLDMTVAAIDSTNTALMQMAKKYGGYVVQVGYYQSVIRVKADRLNEAVAEIETLGEVTDKNISGNDVTDEYTDYLIRLENAKKARDRYLELLAKAENVQAALLVEKELERLNSEIDMLEGKMNRIGHLEEFATITVDVKEKVKLGVLGYVSVGLYEGVKWLFVRN